MSDTSSFLSVGTLLQNKYRILRHLASGGFGNTYLARHIDLDQDVVVKEFFMRGVTERDADRTTVSVSNSDNQLLFSNQREKFKKEAQRIFRLRNDHIVLVLDFFDANNTSYYVMEYIEGRSLSDQMKANGAPFPESQTLDILRQVLDALQTIHGEHIWHMDIKPGNIMIDSQGRCQLIDFGSSKQTDQSGGNTSTAMTYTPGYAPVEQVTGARTHWGPWTDLYALGATLYNLLTGQKPPAEMDITVQGDAAFVYPHPVSDHTRQLVRRLMQPVYTLRPQSANEVIAYLNGKADNGMSSIRQVDSVPPAPSGTLTSSETTLISNRSSSSSSEETQIQSPVHPSSAGAAPPPSVQPVPKSAPKPRRWLWIAAGMLAVLLVVGGVILLTGKNQAQVQESEDVEKWDEEPATELVSQTFTVKGVSFTMVPVAGGTFTMGNTFGKEEYDDDEYPTHQVTLSDYMIGETEVTQALWQAVMGENPSAFTGDLQRPVERVSWDDCQEFIGKLNSLTGQSFRLPTEAEWEYAARGGNQSRGYKYAGSNTLGNVAWFWQNSGDKYLSGTDDDWNYAKIEANNSTTHPVKSKQPNELGLYDMSGNVWEWCQDWYDEYTDSSQTNPKGPSSGSYRVSRGGSWFIDARFCRVSFRYDLVPGIHDYFLGLRLVL